jgi:hypothetical protein
MQLSIKAETGKTIAIEAEPTETINEIKVKINHKEGVPTHMQRLTFDGTQLVDHNTLTNYNIQDGATLKLGNE